MVQIKQSHFLVCFEFLSCLRALRCRENVALQPREQCSLVVLMWMSSTLEEHNQRGCWKENKLVGFRQIRVVLHPDFLSLTRPSTWLPLSNLSGDSLERVESILMSRIFLCPVPAGGGTLSWRYTEQRGGRDSPKYSLNDSFWVRHPLYLQQFPPSFVPPQSEILDGPRHILPSSLWYCVAFSSWRWHFAATLLSNAREFVSWLGSPLFSREVLAAKHLLAMFLDNTPDRGAVCRSTSEASLAVLWCIFSTTAHRRSAHTLRQAKYRKSGFLPRKRTDVQKAKSLRPTFPTHV